MKRRITIEVDDVAFEDATRIPGGRINPAARSDAGHLLCLLIGQARIEGARDNAARGLSMEFGVTLIKDEQL